MFIYFEYSVYTRVVLRNSRHSVQYCYPVFHHRARHLLAMYVLHGKRHQAAPRRAHQGARVPCKVMSASRRGLSDTRKSFLGNQERVLGKQKRFVGYEKMPFGCESIFYLFVYFFIFIYYMFHLTFIYFYIYLYVHYKTP